MFPLEFQGKHFIFDKTAFFIYNNGDFKRVRWGARVGESGGFENRCGCKVTVSSNLTPTA